MDKLQEKNFIKEGYASYAYPFKFWSALVFFVILLICTIDHWAYQKQSKQVASNAFLRVTNREFSLFLWQYPHFMRVHAKNKIGYLPGFQYLNKVNMELPLSEEYVVAPPSVLFFYHTWKRLISSYSISRPILASEFKEFLSHLDEWRSENWLLAPKEYFDLTSSLNELENTDLQTLPLNMLPKEVRQAFFGWKNYFKEGELINRFNPTFIDLENFLKGHPNYARNYWLNIVSDEYPNYLKTVHSGQYDKESQVPYDEMAPFLRVAVYNWLLTNPSL